MFFVMGFLFMSYLLLFFFFFFFSSRRRHTRFDCDWSSDVCSSDLHASRIQLCVFESSGRKEIQRYDLPERTDEIWHGYLPDAMPGLVYGFREIGRASCRERV